MIIKTVEFEYEGLNVFATGIYLPHKSIVDEIEYEIEGDIEVDERTHENIMYNAASLIEASIDTVDELNF